MLLDVIDNETGRRDQATFDEARWTDKVEHWVMPAFSEHLSHDIRDNEEGFVFYFPQADLRVKMKGAEYVRLHRILTNCTARTIWEYLSTGQELTGLLDNVPDEFFGWVRQTAEDLQTQFWSIVTSVEADFKKVLERHDLWRADSKDPDARRTFALAIKDHVHKAAMFRLWDGRPFDELVWKQIRPEHTKPFKIEE